jgi:hypothetical protein
VSELKIILARLILCFLVFGPFSCWAIKELDSCLEIESRENRRKNKFGCCCLFVIKLDRIGCYMFEKNPSATSILL